MFCIFNRHTPSFEERKKALDGIKTILSQTEKTLPSTQPTMVNIDAHFELAAPVMSDTEFFSILEEPNLLFTQKIVEVLAKAHQKRFVDFTKECSNTGTQAKIKTELEVFIQNQDIGNANGFNNIKWAKACLTALNTPQSEKFTQIQL